MGGESDLRGKRIQTQIFVLVRLAIGHHAREPQAKRECRLRRGSNAPYFTRAASDRSPINCGLATSATIMIRNTESDREVVHAVEDVIVDVWQCESKRQHDHAKQRHHGEIKELEAELFAPVTQAVNQVGQPQRIGRAEGKQDRQRDLSEGRRTKAGSAPGGSAAVAETAPSAGWPSARKIECRWNHEHSGAVVNRFERSWAALKIIPVADFNGA